MTHAVFNKFRRINLLFVASLTLAGFGLAASAQEVPALFDVVKVAADDVLNVRAEPSASSPILSGLAPDTKNVEVIALSEDEKWGMVSTGEGNGWVALRFLEAVPISSAEIIPRPITCIGTEPFWSIALTKEGLTWSEPDQEQQPLQLAAERTEQEGYLIKGEAAQGSQIFYINIARELCSDGMSDRSYGFTARLDRVTPEGRSELRGCCTVAPN